MAGDIYHWNINGLKCKRSTTYEDKLNQLSSMLENVATTILNIQETHISNEAGLPNFIETYNHIYHFVKTFSNENDSFAGIITCIRKTGDILVSEILEPGRLLYIQFQNKVNKEITNIFSIYCNPSNTEKQINLMKKMQEKITLNQLTLNNCMVLGDFNFVTSIFDRNSQNMNKMDIDTCKFWNPFEETLCFLDSFRISNPSRRLYSFTSRANKKIRSRIDRLYVSSNMSGRVISTCFLTTNLSDHKILKVSLASTIDKGPGLWILNNSLLEDQIYNSKINEIVDECFNQRGIFEGHRDFWDYIKQKVISYSKQFSKDKAKLSNISCSNHKKEIDTLESINSYNLTPGDVERIDFLKNQISKVQKQKIQGALLRSKIPNFEENDTNISFLSRLEKIKGEGNTIYNLLDTLSNSTCNTTEGIKDIVYQFYKDLYTKENEDHVLQSEFLEKVDVQIETVEKDKLDRSLTEHELLEALTNMNENKSPGPDGLTKEWYECHWLKIKNPYMNAVREIESRHELTEMQKRGAIKISHKKGERNLIKNYRPITLLNVDLKIITKALSERLKTVLPKIIHQNQTCVPGRHIDSSVHIIQNLIDHANINNRNLALIFIDQEKAFDRMSHDFILKTLEKYGLGPYFIQWVKTICTDTKSFVKVNGYETFEFTTERGVRQGCPLSPLLYVLSLEVLSNHIRKNKKIKGYRYTMKNLQYLEHTLCQYADDTTAAVTDMTSMHELFHTLDKYQKATNAKVNKDKTEALWVGKWKNRQDKPLDLKWINDSVKVLGIYVGNKVGSSGTKALSELNFAEQIEIIKNKITFWRNKRLTLITKVKVLNIFVLSRLWYRTQIWDITKNHLDILNRLIRNFIWDDKQGARVRQGVMQMSYEHGGLQLVDINCKIKVQRTARIMHLFTLNNENIERFLADELIGTGKGHSGLSYGLLNNSIRIRSIKNAFYKNALEMVNNLNITLSPCNLESIYEEPLFYNNLFQNPTTNSSFQLTRYKSLLPKTVKTLLNYPHSRIQEINDIVLNLRRALNRVSFSGKNASEYCIKVENKIVDIKSLKFKDIYKIFLKDKLEIREWESRWRNYLIVYTIPWESVWQILHNNYLSPYIKSALWETYHLNFWSNYRANTQCSLCREFEHDITHIVNNCKVLLDLIRLFNMQNKFDNKLKITFGIDGEIVANYILFHIKAVTFRSRFKDFNSILACTNIIFKKCRSNIKRDIKSIFDIASRKNRLEEFKNNFVILPSTNIPLPLQICTLDSENELIFFI